MVDADRSMRESLATIRRVPPRRTTDDGQRRPSLRKRSTTMRSTRLLLGAGLVSGTVLALAAPAAASQPPSTNCWGVVSAQTAKSSGGLGEHASSFAGEPRLGLGNVARAFGLAGPGELGSVLAGIDGDPATGC
jgi:hypothetical protein